MTPGEIAEKPLDKKSPSAATNKGKLVSKNYSRTPAPASTLSQLQRPLTAFCLLQQRAGFKELLHQFVPIYSIGVGTTGIGFRV